MVRSQILQMPRRMRIEIWLASCAWRLRHPCPITEVCWQAGQMRTIAKGLPSASFHGINTITAGAEGLLPDHRSNVVRLFGLHAY